MVFQLLNAQLHTLNTLLRVLTNEQYNCKAKHLADATIGGHTRHILELLSCTLIGYHNGVVDYHNRKRDMVLEHSIEAACLFLNHLNTELVLADKPLALAVEDANDSKTNNPVGTTYYREIIYNTEHIIHHLALIKVAIIEMNLSVTDENFGLASSTIQYKASQKSQHENLN